MRVDRIHFEELFPVGIYANQRLRVEITLGEDDFRPIPINEGTQFELPDPDKVIIKAFRHAKTLVHSAFQTMNPHLYTESGVPVTITQFPDESVNKRVASLIADINQCTEIDKENHLGVQVGLIAYANTVCGHPELSAAYDLKLKQLQSEQY